jgi:hypothetical protein
MKRVTIGLCIAASLVACEGNALRLDGGGSSGGSFSPSGDGGADAMCAPLSSPPGSDASTPSFAPLVGAWTGYVENLQFTVGGASSDALNLVFAAASDGSVTGTMTFGSGNVPAPPTDPSVGYEPNGVPVDTLQGGSVVVLIEGYPYTALQPTLDGIRLRFALRSLEPYDAWCVLQTPYLFAPCEYRCVSDSGGLVTSDGGAITLTNSSGSHTFDLGMFDLCESPFICLCSASGCAIPAEPDVTFDVQMSPGKLDGSLSYGGTPRNVHFTGPVDASP